MIVFGCLLGISMTAQVPVNGREVHGIVLDSESKTPAQYVTVILTVSGGAAARTAITRQDGSFMLTNITPGKYTLSFTAVNYAPRSVEVDYSDTSVVPTVTDTFYLDRSSTLLKEAAVIGQKPIIRQKAGRITYDMQADPESKSSDLLDMMKKIPYLSVDADGNVLLKGNSDFKILLNGKPTGMFEHDLKTVLKSIPASTIQRIDVYTIPPARFDAEGAAGVVDIVTISKVKDEIKGNVNVSEHGPVGGPTVGSNITFKKNKFGFSTFFGGSIINTPQTDNYNDRQTFSTPTFLTQGTGSSSYSRTGYLGTELSYEIDSVHLLTARFNLNGGYVKSNSVLNSLLTDTGGIAQQYTLAGTGKTNSSGMDISADYQISGKVNKNRTLTFSYRYSGTSTDPQYDALVSNVMNFTMPDYKQQNDQHSGENTFQIDYSRPGRKLTIEAGVKGIFRDNRSNFEYDSLNAKMSAFEFDSLFSDHFHYGETVLSAYNSYQYSLGSWDLQGGARLEQTLINGDFLAETQKVTQNYVNVFPNLVVNKGFKDQSSLSVGFSERIKRPGINRLNPFVDRTNPDFLFTGNPTLRPVVVNSISANYSISKKINFSGGVDYTYLRKMDFPISSYDSSTGVTTNTFSNTGRIDGLSAFVYAGWPITKHLNISFNGNFIYFWMQGVDDGKLEKTQLPTYALNFSATYSFGKGWRIRSDATILSKNPTGFQGTTNGLVSSSFDIGKQFLDQRMTVDVNVANPFTTYRNIRTQTSGPDFYQTSNNQVYYRIFGVSLNYNFGGMKGNLKKNKKTIQNNDLSNGKGL